MSEDLKSWTRYALTAGALRDLLAEVPDDTPVILQKDAEGNSYSPLSSVDTTDYVYEPESTWSGEVRDTMDSDYEPDDEDVKIVLLGPVN